MSERGDPGGDLPFARSLAGLLTRIGADREVWDRDVTRDLAAALAEERQRLAIPALAQLGLRDVVLTFRMEQALDVVITGTIEGLPGGLTWTLSEWELPAVEAFLQADEVAIVPSICTLDGSWRGKTGVLRVSGRVIPAGQRVRARALVTVDGVETVRVEALGLSDSVAVTDVVWDGDADPQEPS